MRISTSMRWLVVALSAAMLLAVAAACGSETVEVPGETVVVEKVVTETVEVPGETVVKEVIKEVQVPGETVVVKEEVVKEVMVPGETVVVEKVVTETVEVPGETVTVEVVKTVEVPGETVVVEKEVVKTVEVPGQTVVVEKVVTQTVEVPGETVVVEKEVVKVVEVAGPERIVVKEVRAGYVTDPTTGKVVSAPEYGGTLNTWFVDYSGESDTYFGWVEARFSGVVQKLGIGDWGIDRDVWDHKSGPLPVSAITGRLAESWEMPDDKTYVFNIRKGVHWHNKAPMNGRELTASDVEYNFHRMLGLGKFTDAGPTPFGGAVSLTGIPFESITATDKWTVVMKLKEPYLPALRLILIDYMVYILPPEVIEESRTAEVPQGRISDWRNSVGTGPFMLTDFVESSSWTWTKNPDYWGYDEKYPENRLPYVDELRWLIIPEEATAMAALRSGKIDFRRYAMSLDSVLSLQRTNPEITAHGLYIRSQDAYATNVRVPPFNDIRVRKAMQMGLDLETISATYWKGYASATPQGMVGAQGFYIPFDEWPEEVKKGYMYDPEGAEKLLDEAGYPRGPDGIRFKTRLQILQGTQDLGYAEIAASYWAEIGVDVEIDVFEDWTAYHEGLFSGTYEGMMGSIAGTISNPLMSVSEYRSDAQWNRPLHQWPELDALVDAALAATTIEEQQRLIADTDMYAIEKHWQIWGPKPPGYVVVQPWVIGYNGELSLGSNELNAIHARIWIDQDLKKEMGY